MTDPHAIAKRLTPVEHWWMVEAEKGEGGFLVPDRAAPSLIRKGLVERVFCGNFLTLEGLAVRAALLEGTENDGR